MEELLSFLKCLELEEGRGGVGYKKRDIFSAFFLQGQEQINFGLGH